MHLNQLGNSVGVVESGNCINRQQAYAQSSSDYSREPEVLQISFLGIKD